MSGDLPTPFAAVLIGFAPPATLGVATTELSFIGENNLLAGDCRSVLLFGDVRDFVPDWLKIEPSRGPLLGD